MKSLHNRYQTVTNALVLLINTHYTTSTRNKLGGLDCSGSVALPIWSKTCATGTYQVNSFRSNGYTSEQGYLTLFDNR